MDGSPSSYHPLPLGGATRPTSNMITFACVCGRCRKSHRLALCLLLGHHLTFVGAIRASAGSGNLPSLLSSYSLTSHWLLRAQSHPWVSSCPCSLAESHPSHCCRDPVPAFVTVPFPASAASLAWEGDAGCQAVSEWSCDIMSDRWTQQWDFHVCLAAPTQTHLV